MKLGLEKIWTVLKLCLTLHWLMAPMDNPYSQVDTFGNETLSPPHIFITFCAEGLSSMLYKKTVEIHKKITGFQVARGSPPLTHLLFTNDSLLFCQANLPEWLGTQRILNTYEAASRQCLNQRK